MARIISLIRYRFFFFAGIFPYLLGQVLAFNQNRNLNWQNFWLGFLGIILVLMAVELLNEYFDAKVGGDRIFLKEKPNIPDYFFPLALCSMLFAFLIGLYLTLQVGWLIILFSFLGFLGAYFYVGPPLRWSYRGLGELVIALCYGPLMVLGSFYLQTKRVEGSPVFVSLILGLLLFSLSLVNEIPDYYQDRLVGKRNIVVRLGRKKAVRLFILSLMGVFVLLAWGLSFHILPFPCLVTLLLLPWVLKAIKIAKGYYDMPHSFLPAISMTLFVYLTVILVMGISYLK